MLPLTPTKLGRYEIVEEIGKGAMGVVYLARDPLIGRLVALKTFRIGYSVKDAELEHFRIRFIREAQSAGILSHPNIVTIHDVVEKSEDGLAFIAMEYVRGTNLKSMLQEDRRPTLPWVADILEQIAEALDYAHSCRVVHRDVKPANILITADNRVKITDFGIARLDTSNLTQEGQLLGTPNYMAPEQILGREVDHRADIFSLGVVLYEMLTRHKPFQGENLTVVSHRIVYDQFTPPEEYVADLPPGMLVVLDRALEKDPSRRYQKARELAADVRRVLGLAAPRDALNETQNLSEALWQEARAASPPPRARSTRTSEWLGRLLARRSGGQEARFAAPAEAASQRAPAGSALSGSSGARLRSASGAQGAAVGAPSGEAGEAGGASGSAASRARAARPGAPHESREASMEAGAGDASSTRPGAGSQARRGYVHATQPMPVPQLDPRPGAEKLDAPPPAAPAAQSVTRAAQAFEDPAAARMSPAQPAPPLRPARPAAASAASPARPASAQPAGTAGPPSSWPTQALPSAGFAAPPAGSAGASGLTGQAAPTGPPAPTALHPAAPPRSASPTAPASPQPALETAEAMRGPGMRDWVARLGPINPVRLAAAATGVLLVALGAWGSLRWFERTHAAPANSSAEVSQGMRQRSVLSLMREGERLFEAGDFRGAAAQFRAAEQMTPGHAGPLHRRQEAERLAAERERRLNEEREIAGRLAAARQDLFGGRLDEAEAAAQAVLRQSPGNTAAQELLADAEQERARTRERQARNLAQVSGAPGPARPAASDRRPPVRSEQTPAQAAVPKTATLQVDFSSSAALPECTLMILVNGQKVMQEGYRSFRKGFFRDRPTSGSLHRSFEITSGDAELAVYVTPPGKGAIVQKLEGNFLGGGSRQLEIQVSEDGKLSSRLN